MNAFEIESFGKVVDHVRKLLIILKDASQSAAQTCHLVVES